MKQGLLVVVVLALALAACGPTVAPVGPAPTAPPPPALTPTPTLPVLRTQGEPTGAAPGSFAEAVARAQFVVLADVVSVQQGPDYFADPSGAVRVPTQRVMLQVVKAYRGAVGVGQTVILYQHSVGVTDIGAYTQQIGGRATAAPASSPVPTAPPGSASIPIATARPQQVFMINENDPLYAPGERYMLALTHHWMDEHTDVQAFQPQPWQAGMVVALPESRLLVAQDGTVARVAADAAGRSVPRDTERKPLDEIETLIAAAPTPTPIVPTTTPVAATYQGLALPTPVPANADNLQPPPAWLIVGGSAVLATGGNTSITRKSDEAVQHADALAPQQSRALATAALPANMKAIIVIGSRSITAFQARVQAWAAQPTAIFFDPASGRPLKAEEQRDGAITVFTLESIGNAGDQILAMSISFDDSYSAGNASYIWRLNSAQTTAVIADAGGVSQRSVIPASIEATLMPAAVVDLSAPIASPTPLHRPTTITLNDIKIGQTLYLSVGDTFTLDRSIPQPIHLRDERIVAPVPDAQDVYKAIATGQTALEVTVDPCAEWSQPTACTQPVGAPLIMTIVVE